jgi:hypothetical protein
MSRNSRRKNKAATEVSTKSVEIVGSKGSTNISPPIYTTTNLLSQEFIPFGEDNLFPQAIALLNRKSGVHRGILSNKVKYLTGKGFSFDEANVRLGEFVNESNSIGESLTDIARKVFKDDGAIGNYYLEVVKVEKNMALFHHDYTTCRVGKNKKAGRMLIHPNWSNYANEKKALKELPIYPEFEKVEGLERSIIHVKDYEPEFEHYGIPEWLAGMQAASIAYKTNKWNVSRLDNGYRLSGAIVIDGAFSSDETEQEFNKSMDGAFSGEGQTGKMMKIKKNTEGDNTKILTFPQTEDADWISLHKQSKEELLIAHQWFPSLAGLNTSDGFSTERLLNEYAVALSTVIIPAQEAFLRVIRNLLWDIADIDAIDLEFINKPPLTEKAPYLMVWEARKQDGLDYDENDPLQRVYLANITKTEVKKEEVKGLFKRLFS